MRAHSTDLSEASDSIEKPSASMAPVVVQETDDSSVGQQGEGSPKENSPSEFDGGDNLRKTEERDASRLLWVGNVAGEVSEALLFQLFGEYGSVDNVSAYPTRSYAFVEFKSVDDAKAAKAGLQGKLVKGHSLRIEYARPAKPSRHLWIWGVGETVTKEQLEAEFRKFGALEDFKLLRDRNTALAEYKNIQEASAAVNGLNKKVVHGSELRVDFLRSQPVKRGNDRAGHERPDNLFCTMTDEKGAKEGYPSDTLWIGFPPPSKVDEEGLRRAFILFGEVERITTFPDRSYCFVQFRNVDEATRAKEGLQGRLLNDPRILIRFSSNEGSQRRVLSKSETSYHAPPHQRVPLVHSDIPRQSVLQYDSSRMYGRQSSGYLVSNFVRDEIPEAGDYMVGDCTMREHKRAKITMPSFSADGSDLVHPGVDLMHSSYIKAPSAHYLGNGYGHGSMDLPSNSTGVKWKGAIAKAGSVICRVQSFPVRKGFDVSLPPVVNCVARTSLDMLAQHFDQAANYGVICFVPDGDQESSSYQDFVTYLHEKSRAGVANMSDVATMFLVPPSEFAEKILGLHGDYLFGLVMKSYEGGAAQTTYRPPVSSECFNQSQPQVNNLSALEDLASLLRKTNSTNQNENMSLSPELVASLTSFLNGQRTSGRDDLPGSSGYGASVSGFDVPSNESEKYGMNLLQAFASNPSSLVDNTRHSQSSRGAYSPDLRHGGASGQLTHEINQLAAALTSHSSQQQQQQARHMQDNIANMASQVLGRQVHRSSHFTTNGGLETDQDSNTGESKNRFQATLQLAAALLQRMHSISGSDGAS